MDSASIKKQSITFTTIDLINEFGIQGVSTREVAKRQGISHGAVFQYFPKKNDLLLSVIEYFSLFDHDLFHSTRIRNMKSKEAIIYYIENYMIYYESYPAITAVYQMYDVLQNDTELGDKVKNVYNTRLDFMTKLIEAAQKEGSIRNTEGCTALPVILTSYIRGICLKWRIEGYGFQLRKTAMQAINMILDAFSL
ncbi:MAG: TetR/AcrR family transcriptional regulator [Bacillota bacterium]|nr:TetR/AcrR family transcriptional regulator [Bacillota bacterium]